MMSQKLSQRTLLLCFSLWLIQYRAVAKIRNVYHGSLLKWIFSAWGEWAREKHIVILKSQEFLNQRRIKLAFRKWCQRFSQSTETERLYQQAWNNYLRIILQQWGIWAKTSHKLHSLQQVFQQQQSRHALQSSFTFWKSLTVKVKSIRSNAMHKLLYSIFRDWRLAVREMRNKKHKVLHFQVQSYTLLVKRQFFQWHEAYKKRQQLTEERRVHIEQIALNFAGIWRRKAQKRRGEMLTIMFEKRKTKHCFQHWRASLSHIQFLYNQLDDWSSKKNMHVLKVCLRSWQTQLVANQARKLYMSRLLHAMLAEWRVFAKVNRERRIRGLALKKALQERSLHVYFQYWVAVTKVKLSVQQNVELKLQIRVFRAWRHYSHKLHHLRELQALMTRNVCTRILHNAFQNIRWRAEYCTSLHDMAERIVKDKELATMRAVVVMWKERINKLVSVRCYKHMLTIRVVKRWHRFVHKKCLDRKQDRDNWEKAVSFYNKILCKSAFSAMKLEVSVHHMVEKRSQRLCNKYAKMWKNKVDLCVTAIFLEQEFVQKRVWAKWRREYIKAYSTQKIVEQYEKQTLSQIFKAWRKLAVSTRSKLLQLQQIKPGQASQGPVDNQRDTRVSMLPVPLSQSRQSPVFISSPVGKSGHKTNNNH
ncbi:unnamed protein product [Lymnaea stagnalis]|uniref:Sfi1 spindle body domain-containing protein n=1 Tax=Lymnaea stagnalis TaxID=6523 RepID=A0AAV2HHW4_LYMST